MRWTDEQEAAIQYIATGYHDLLIDSVAGSGKTSTIVQGIKRMRGKSFILLSFSTDVAETMAQRTGKPNSCHSLHSFGLRQIRRNVKGSIKVDKNKSWKLVKKYGTNWDYRKQNKLSFQSRVVELINLGKMILATSPAQLLEAGLQCGVMALYGEEKYAWEMLKLSVNIKHIIDFADMLWLPCIWKRSWSFEKFDVVVIDEVQDCSASLLTFAGLITKQGGRAVMTGDRHQNIYSTFAGSDPKLFTKIEQKPGLKQLNLTTSFRCSQNICYEAQEYVPHIRPREGAPAGFVGHGRYSEVTSGMVVCRNNAPLMRMWIKLLTNGVKSTLVGRDTGKKLIKIINGSKAKTIGKLLDYMENRVENAVKKLMKLGLKDSSARRTDMVMKLRDEYDVIDALSDITSTVEGMVKKLDSIFSEKRSGVILQTVHKAKGQEVDDGDPLYFLDFDLIDKRNKTELEIAEARNIKYVGITRGKDSLKYITSPAKKKSR